MKYELISPESARALEGYIPKYVLENPGFDSLFFYAAVEESGGAVGLAAVDPIVDGPELLSIGISPDYEGKGYGSELLSFISADLFDKNSEERFFSASVNLSPSAWEKLDHFLVKNHFAKEEDSPVYHVTLSAAADAQILKAAASPLKGILPLKEVPDQKLRIFSHTVVQNGLFHSISRKELDEDVSLFYIPENDVRGCVLFAPGADGFLQNTWIYIDPEYSGTATLAHLLAEALRVVSEKYPPDTRVSFIMVEENSRALIRKVFPDIEPASEIRLYERLLTGSEDAAGRRDEPQFEEVSEKNMCCSSCAHCTGNIFACEIYARKPDAVVDGESCLYFEEE